MTFPYFYKNIETGINFKIESENVLLTHINS